MMQEDSNLNYSTGSTSEGANGASSRWMAAKKEDRAQEMAGLSDGNELMCGPAKIEPASKQETKGTGKKSPVERYCLDESSNHNDSNAFRLTDIMPLPVLAVPSAQSMEPGAYAQRSARRESTHRHQTQLNHSTNQSGGSFSLMSASHRNEGLVEARPVGSRNDLEVATPVDPENQEAWPDQKRLNQRRGGFVLCCIPVVLLAVVGLVITLAQRSPASDNAAPLNISATAIAPFKEPVLALLPSTTQTIILEDTEKVLPQSMAYEWILKDPDLQQYSTGRLLQRFALASFYFATDGPNWKHRGGDTVTITIFPEPKHFVALDALEGLPSATSVSTVTQRNITRDKWLEYGTHECNWYSTSVHSTCDPASGSITVLELQDNNLAGKLPAELALLTSLTQLSICFNQIGGTLITQLGQLTNLATLQMNSNKFIGLVPSEIGLLSTSLQHLYLADNQLEGSFPSQLWKLSNLLALNIARNHIAGTFPNEIGDLLPKSLVIKVDRTLLVGTLPTSLGKCSNLAKLAVSEMDITGPIPTEFGRLPNLALLFLYGTRLTGRLPTEIGLLGNLTALRLQGNPKLSGTIPVEWVGLNESLSELDVGETAINGTIPSSLCQVPDLTFDCSPTLCGCGSCTC